MADKKVTPHQKPKGGRNTRTPSNMNSTYCDSVRTQSSHKSGRPRSSVKSNLDVTCLNATVAPRFKSSIPAVPVVDTELELDLAYNDYLQALLKKQLISEKIKSHEEQMDNQICQQLQEMYSMEKKRSEMKDEIEKVDKLNEINDLIKTLQGTVEELEALEKKYHLQGSLDKLLLAMKKACNKIVLKKVKPIVTQEDYDKLLELLEGCSNSIENMLASTNNYEEIHSLAESIDRLTEAKNKLMDKQEYITSRAETLIFKMLSDSSDYFANENGY